MRLRHNNFASTPQTETAAFKKWFGKSKVVDADGKPLVVYHGTIRGGFVEFDLEKIDKHHSGFFFTNKRSVAESYGTGSPLPPRTNNRVPDIRTVADIRRFVKSPENNFADGWRIVLHESRQVTEPEVEDYDLSYTGMGAQVITTFLPYWERNGKTEDIGSTDRWGYYPPYTNLVSDIREALRHGGPPTSGTYAVYLRMLKPMIVDGKSAPWMSIPYKGGYYKTDQLSAIAKEKGHDGLILRNIYDSAVVQDEISDVYVVFDPHNIKSATANVGTFDRKNADIRMNPRARRKNPHHPHPQTETPEFKAWFGNSKMLDEHGEPERLYHLTASEFSVFKPGGHDPRLSGRVIYLTPYPHNIPAGHNTSGSIGDARVPGETWGYRQGTNVMPVYASIQRPLYIFDADDAQYAERFKFDSFAFPRTVSDKSLAALKEAGYDGIVYAGWRDAERFDLRTGRNVEIIAFEPTQIKSAVGNRGTFDPSDPDIRHNPPRRRKNSSDDGADFASYNTPYAEDDFDARRWNNELQGLCNSLDYALMQDGDDIGRRLDRYGGRGYHDTSPERAARIRREGLGNHPGLTYHGGGGIEGHESPFWMCAWASPDLAARLLKKGRENGWRDWVEHEIADALSKHLAQRYPNLKAVWFYETKSGGGISKYAGARCSFNLRKVVEWLSANAEDGPYLYNGHDTGWCLSWSGPRIPPKFLRWTRRNPR